LNDPSSALPLEGREALYQMMRMTLFS
jgi:hypothetical protein